MAWNALRIPEGEGNELITVEDFDFPVSELFASYYSEKYGGKRQEMSERPEVPIPQVKDLPDWRALNQQYMELGMIEAEKYLSSQNKPMPATNVYSNNIRGGEGNRGVVKGGNTKRDIVRTEESF